VLRRGGQIALFWNFGAPTREVRERLAPIYEHFAPALANQSLVLGNRPASAQVAVDGLSASAKFSPTTVSEFACTTTYDTGSWTAQISTHSDHHTLPAEARERLLAAISDRLSS
jgi:hypothetical protein